MTLLDELKGVHERMQFPEHWSPYGICDSFVFYKAEFMHLACNWPKYSGSINYPVPAVNCKSPSAEFIGSIAGESMPEWERMWDRENSPYAALRWELLEWCIEQLESDLDVD